MTTSTHYRTISDLEARKIASSWHGGGGTALYAFASTGAIDTARVNHDLTFEIAAEIAFAKADIAGNLGPSSGTDDVSALEHLLDYVNTNGPRGPVDGWSQLTW